MPRFIVLLRGINVGKRKAPMAPLRDACRDAGFSDAQTYIQSGNLVLSSGLAVGEVEAAIERIVERDFGFPTDTIARTAEQWADFAAGSPFPEAEAARPNRLQLCLAKEAIEPGAVDHLMERATLGERVAQAGDALWVDFTGGIAESRLLPAVFDKAAGSSVTARNWNTVLRLHAMASA